MLQGSKFRSLVRVCFFVYSLTEIISMFFNRGLKVRKNENIIYMCVFEE